MDITETSIVHNDILQQIKHLRLMDDVLMVKCFEDNPECTELLLQLIIKKSSFRVDQVNAMWHGSSAGLAILATDGGGWHYKIRVFRDDTADRKRKKGTELFQSEFSAAQTGIDQDIAGHYAVYIIEHGAVRKPIDHSGILIDSVDENGWCGFGVNTFYVNCDRKNRSPLGKLVYDFSCTDPSYMNYTLLADRVRYFKENRQGVREICEMLEQKKQRTQNCEAPKDE